MIALARHARKFFPLADRKQRCAQAAKWAAAVHFLGNRWILRHPVVRLQEPRPV